MIHALPDKQKRLGRQNFTTCLSVKPSRCSAPETAGSALRYSGTSRANIDATYRQHRCSRGRKQENYRHYICNIDAIYMQHICCNIYAHTCSIKAPLCNREATYVQHKGTVYATCMQHTQHTRHICNREATYMRQVCAIYATERHHIRQK